MNLGNVKNSIAISTITNKGPPAPPPVAPFHGKLSLFGSAETAPHRGIRSYDQTIRTNCCKSGNTHATAASSKLLTLSLAIIERHRQPSAAKIAHMSKIELRLLNIFIMGNKDEFATNAFAL